MRTRRSRVPDGESVPISELPPGLPVVPPPPNGIPVDNDPPGTVRVIGMVTDIGKKYSFIAPAIPIPPFSGWHKWIKEHEISVHCALEWKDAKGQWYYAEMRSSKWENGSREHQVGQGQFPATGYVSYGIFINPGRVPRVIDIAGRPVVITLDEAVKVDYKQVEAEIRKYGAFGKRPGDPGTGGYGKENVGLGGPAYKPAQNSNTMIHYILKKCGLDYPAPPLATGWDTVPTFPYSSDRRYPKYEY